MDVLKINKMNRIIIFFIFFLTSLIAHAQDFEYGILVKSKINPRSVWPSGENNGIHNIMTGSVGCTIEFESQFDNDYKYCFFYVTDEPSEIIFTEIQSSSELCGFTRTIIPYNKKTFQITPVMGCFADSEIIGIHLPEPGADSNHCLDDIISLQNGWNWEYQYNSDVWKAFPAEFQDKKEITFKIKDLEGYEGKTNIHFRTGYKTQFTNTITYNIIGCSPELAVNPPKTGSTRCKNDPSGSVTLEFKTPLKDGDKFLFNIWNSGVPTSKFVEQKDIINNTYTWKGLAEGTYTMKYQAQSITNINEEVGSSVITTYTFTIGSPAKLESEFKYLTDPLCHDGNGSITIKTTGGTGNYYYKINSDAIKQFDMTTTIDDITKIHWATQTIPLPSSERTDYKILITDQEGCKQYK